LNAPSVRRARADDAPALVRLRSTMVEAMALPRGGADAPWRAAAHSWFRHSLARTDAFAAFLVDDPCSE
jgi:hypothetical protein